MKKLFVLLITVIILLSVSCMTKQKHLYFYETDQNVKIKGTVPLVSIQVSGREYRWTEKRGNVSTTYIFYFENANRFANILLKAIPIKDYGIVVPDILQKGKVNLKNYTTEMAAISNKSYDWGIPVVDEINNPKKMDGDVLTCLNDNLDSDYYLVLDADILSIQFPKWFGLVPFKIKYEFSLVMYDRKGNKVLSKHYRYFSSEIPGSIYDVESYYKGLELALDQAKEKIIKDLISIGATPVIENKKVTGERI